MKKIKVLLFSVMALFLAFCWVVNNPSSDIPTTSESQSVGASSTESGTSSEGSENESSSVGNEENSSEDSSSSNGTQSGENNSSSSSKPNSSVDENYGWLEKYY